MYNFMYKIKFSRFFAGFRYRESCEGSFSKNHLRLLTERSAG